jgi:hypothetical protein
VRRAGFSDAVNLIYSRSFRADDLLVAVSTSTNNIAMKTKWSPMGSVERMLTPSRIYNRLVDVGGDRLFEAVRNARFVDAILAPDKGPAVSTRINGHFPDVRPEWSLPSAFFLVIPGSGNPHKRWPTEYFAETVQYVMRHYGLTPVVCGGAGDREVTSSLCDALRGVAVNLTGATSLPELVTVLRMARFLISIDTGAVHLAAAVGCPVFALFSGFHYGRFSPYPGELAEHFFSIYPDETEEKIARDLLKPEQVPMGSMSNISPGKVIRILEKEIMQIS